MALSNLIWWPWHGFTSGAPAAAEYHPVGDNPEARRARLRRQQEMYDEEETMMLLLLSGDL